MVKPRYSAFHMLVQKLASTRPVAWLFAHILHHTDRILLKLTAGRVTVPSALAGLPTAQVTTVGAKSGLARTLPLVFIRDEHDPSTFAIIASNWGQDHNPAWYYNLKACPQATCIIDGKTSQYVAHEAIGEEYEKFWRRASDTYIGYPLYQQRAGGRHIPIMVMTPANV